MQLKENKRILIVDDEPDICFLLKRLLCVKQNIVCESCFKLQDGLNFIPTFKPDIIFLDNHLSDGMGIDAIPEIKIKYPQVKIVMISAYDTLQDRTLALDRGADAFVSKPFSGDAIYKVLDTIEDPI